MKVSTQHRKGHRPDSRFKNPRGPQRISEKGWVARAIAAFESQDAFGLECVTDHKIAHMGGRR